MATEFDRDRFLAELHAHLVIVGMAHGEGHKGMADANAEEILDSCRRNGVEVKILGHGDVTLAAWIDGIIESGLRVEVSFSEDKKLQPGRG